MNIIHKLEELADAEYKVFIAKLVPTLPPEYFIGVRVPKLRKLAADLKNTPEAAELLRSLPHATHEENCLHVFLLNKIKDFDECLAQVEAFLPYVNNWAVCDSLCPDAFKKNVGKLYPHIERWIGSGELYTVRFGIEMLMNLSLGEYFDVAQAERVAAVNAEEYYVSMMVAWYFATAMVVHYDAVLPFIEGGVLDAATHNRAIQKAVDSYRISDEQKAYLKTLRRKS